MKTTSQTHQIIKSTPEPWAYCTICFRDVSYDGSRHYQTNAKKVAARKAEAEAK
jgi:hypothetical protein